MLKQDRVLSEKNVPHAPEFAHDVAQGFTLYRGALSAVCQDGTIVPVGATNTPSPIIACVGIASRGSECGSEGLLVCKGCYALPFDTKPDWSSIGQDVYALDDETASLGKGSDDQQPPTRLKIGTLAGIEGGDAYVLIS